MVKVGSVAKVYKSTMAIGRAGVGAIGIRSYSIVYYPVVVYFNIFTVIDIYVYVFFTVVYVYVITAKVIISGSVDRFFISTQVISF
jgi:hypothetical protein